MARSSARLRALILAGTAEARILAVLARSLPWVELVVSYAGVTSEREAIGRAPSALAARVLRAIVAHHMPPSPMPPSPMPAPPMPPPPRPLARTAAELIASANRPPPERAEAPLATRTGGFGGAAGLTAWLHAEGIGAVIDATHPFAVRMQANAVAACAAAGVPRLRLLRPEWPARPGWVGVADLAEAAAALPPGARVLLTSGRDWAPFAGRPDCRFWLRSIEPVALPGHIQPILGRPPFERRAELALMRRLSVTHLVAKNSGGDTGKLDAAGEAGATVLMVARPVPPAEPPPGAVVGDPAEALAWLAGVVDRARGA
jgi:precorrin-6A/cobalt-precorrin-6A reductase